MIPGDLLSAFPHRQFHTLPGLLDSWAALPNSYPNACMPMQGGSLYNFYDGLWYDPAGRRTHDLPCERRTRYRLSQPDTVFDIIIRTSIKCVIKVYIIILQLFFQNIYKLIMPISWTLKLAWFLKWGLNSMKKFKCLFIKLKC